MHLYGSMHVHLQVRPAVAMWTLAIGPHRSLESKAITAVAWLPRCAGEVGCPSGPSIVARPLIRGHQKLFRAAGGMLRPETLGPDTLGPPPTARSSTPSAAAQPSWDGFSHAFEYHVAERQ
jgi:hypothetical protein